MITYDIRSRDLKGIFISFANYERRQAEEYYDNIKKTVKETDCRYGSVLVKSTWESDEEANERRIAWLENQLNINEGIFELNLQGTQRTLKSYIDFHNKAKFKDEVLKDYFKDKGLPEIGLE